VKKALKPVVKATPTPEPSVESSAAPTKKPGKKASNKPTKESVDPSKAQDVNEVC
jgi:hypothetical protein